MAKKSPLTPYKEQYNEDFPEIYLLTKKLLLSRKWHNKLKAETKKLQGDTKSSAFTKTMQKKQLLFNVKADIFQYFYQTNQDQNIAKELVTQQDNLTADQLKQNLRLKIAAEEKTIDRLEKDLRQYSWREALLSAPARFFANSLHYRVSEQFFSTAEELSHEGPWQDLSCIRAELDDNTISGLSIIGAIIALTADYKLSRNLGFGQQHAISIANSLYSDITPLLNLGNKWDISEETMVTYVLPLLKSATTLSIILAGTILLNPFSTLTLVAVATIYLLSQFSNYFLSLLLKPYTPNLPLPEHTQKFLQLFKQIAIAIISGIIAKKLVLPIFTKVGNQFTLPEVEEKTKSPYEVLDLNPFATVDEIKTICRKLRAQFHPDTAKTATEAISKTARFLETNSACDQLLQDGTPQPATRLIGN